MVPYGFTVSKTNRLSIIYGSPIAPARPLTREEALAGQRGRLLAGIASAVAENGYADTTIAEIAKRAGTSKRTFYEHFSDKQACYLAAYERAVEYILSQMAAAMPASSDWKELCRGAVHQYLAILSVEPEFAHAFIVEVARAGDRALDQRDTVHAQFASFIEAIHVVAQQQDVRIGPLTPTIFTSLVAAINDLVMTCVRKGRLADLPDLEDTVILLISGLFFGTGLATEAGIAAKAS